MAVSDAVILFAKRWADALIYVEQDAGRGAANMNAADPLSRKIAERRRVLRTCRRHSGVPIRLIRIKTRELQLVRYYR